MNIIEIIGGQKVYKSGRLLVPVLFDINLTIKKGEMLAIMGPSGSGKSTLMNIIGLLDRLTAGELKLDDRAVHLNSKDATLAKLRGEKIGFVFQSFNLLSRLSALANVLLPTGYVGAGRRDRQTRAKQLLTQLGLKERINHWPEELSGGEKQRVAIARALINNPEIILADEPTGNLDSKSGQEVMRILDDLHKKGKTVLVITHDKAIAKHCQAVIDLLDGRIVGGNHG